MKKNFCLQKTAYNLTKGQGSSQVSKQGLPGGKFILAIILFLFSFSVNLKAQLIQEYDFAGLTYSATTLGYEKVGIGIYYRQNSGGTISFGSTSCYGYSISAPTGSNRFFFKAEKNINSITIKGTGTGSNRTFSSLATSNALNGTYTTVTQTNSSTMTTSSVCGKMIVTPTTVIPAGTFMQFIISGNLNITSIEFDFVPTGTPPLVTTNTVTCGQNNTIVNGTVTPGTMPLHSSGIIWSTSSTPLDLTLSTKTVNTPAATTSFNNNATGLIPATTYYYRAYVKDLAGNVYYGATLSCQTLAATLPTLTTTPAFNILSYKASSGGTNIDSGGLAITQKGICWSTSPNPTTAGSKIQSGPNGTNFTALMRVLSPCVTYYVRAYAINAVGTGYGNQVTFQAGCPATPALIANPLSLNFGNIPYNTSATVFSYTLTGYNLTPTSGNITLNPPAGYTLSLNPGTGFVSPLIIPYTGGAMPTKTIYVKLATTGYGTFAGGVIHTGGGTTPQNADTVNLSGAIIQDPTITTNAGTDFWTGFGYQRRMDRESGDASEAKMSLYISVPQGAQSATVNVELPGIPGATGFPKQNLTVTPGTVLEVTGFPTGDPNDELNPNGLPDSRLYYTGVSKRGVHIYSTNGVPIAVWMHTYENSNSAAGAMLFPTNTWNNSYTVQAYGGKTTDVVYAGGYSNVSNPNSFFFVVASEDNTPVWFKPSQDILDSVSGALFSDNNTAGQVKYLKGTQYGPIMLNKGQIFNAMGFIQGSGSSANGLDLSGTTVWSTCSKKIAVFGGNGRVLVNDSTFCRNANSGSDHLIQQMFPKVAWGTKYITVPTKTMEHNLFRIYVDDVNTKVWVNDPNHTTPLTGLVNGLYYRLFGDKPYLIESDKPVNVTQFISTGDCIASLGDKGNGDPEMIILSPVQQAINRATVYSAGMKNSGASYNGHYINVVIRKGGIPSFRLDGLATADTGRNQGTGANTGNCYNAGGTIPIANAFVKLPYDTNYYVAKFKVAPLASHTLFSDSAFNAIAYGMGDGESYGYNAGTNIKDLTKPLFIDNPYLPNNTNNTSCTNNPIKLKAVLPYPPSQVDSIRWYMSSVNGVSPQQDVTIYNPSYDSTYVSDGVSYYVYKNPVTYTFTSAGSYHITGIVGGTFATQCGSTSPFDFNINIVDPGFADFTIQYNPCVNDSVHFTDASSGNGFPINGWRWDFGDGRTDTIHQNPVIVYATHAIYNIKLRAINSIGCYADTTKSLDMTSLLIAKFGVHDTICAGSSVIFSDSSSNAGLSGAIAHWYWDYGDGVKDTVHVSSNMAHTYSTPGKYYVTLKVETNAGCTATYLDSVDIRPNPVANFTPPAGVCLPGSTVFTNTTTISDGTIANVTYLWNFGDATTSTATSPSHTYPNAAPPPGGYNVVLTATSQYGCVGTKTTALTAVYTKPVAAFTVQSSACLKDSIVFTDNSSGTGQTMTSWYWEFGDGNTASVKNPKYAYATVGTYNVRLAVTSDKGCASDTSAPFSVKVNPLPNAGFILPSGCLGSGTITFADTSSITPNDGTQTPFTYVWTFGDPGSGAANTSNAQNGQHTYTAPGSYQIIQQVTSANGCKDSDTSLFVVTGTKPKADFTVISAPLCSNKAVNIQNATTIAIGTVTKIEIVWDDVNFPAVIETFNSPTSAQIFSHNYTDFQTPSSKAFTIRLRAYSGTTCLHDTTKVITLNASPKTQFLTVPGICLGDSRFITQGSQTSSLPGNPSYSGNGINAAGLFNSSTAGAGNHQLQYLFVTTAGCRDSSQSTITVWPAPVANFGVSIPRCEKNNVVFTDSSNAGAGTITSWTWTFGDAPGSVTNTNNLPFTHLYNTANPYVPSLQINTSNGCTSTVFTRPITVNPLPKVGFTMPGDICLPDGYGIFYDASTIADGSESSFTYSWAFGDGGMSLQKDPSHRYTSVGPFTVKLRVVSNNGCIDSLSKTFNSIHPQPKASFVTTPTIGEVCLGDSIRFISTSNGMDGTVVKWRWTLGDASTDTVANFWHTYSNAQNYTVKLYVFNSFGCVSDTATGTAIVDGYPTLEAGPDVYVLQGSSVMLNPTVTNGGNNIKYLWDGDYLSDVNVKNPLATPPADQRYIIQVTNGLGCSTKDTMMVRLYKPPVFPNAFSPNGDNINDTWSVTYLNTYATAKVEVFNRYGQVVFASTGYDKPWDGTMNGKPLPIGVYYYVVHLGVIKQPLTGWITLLR